MLGTDELTVLASSAETGGALLAGELRMPPGGGPPMMHRHAPGEVYYVIDGEFTFYSGGFGTPVVRAIARAGQVVSLAGGTPHTIRNESDKDAVAFVVHAPAAPMEDFSRAAALLAADGNLSMEAVLEIAQRNGIEMLGPIPAAV